MSAPQPSNPYKSIEELGEIRQTFEEAGISEASITLWVAEKALQIQGVCIESPNPKFEFRVRLPSKQEAEDFVDRVRKDFDSEVMGQVVLKNRAIIGFRAKLPPDSGTSRTVQFFLPTKLLSLQRRKSQRYEIPMGYEIYGHIPDPRHPEKLRKRRILDVSGEGFSFVVPRDQADLYSVGLKLKGAILSLRGEDLKGTVEIRNQRAVPPEYKLFGIRIGVSILEMDKLDTDFLAGYVLENMIQYSRSGFESLLKISK